MAALEAVSVSQPLDACDIIAERAGEERHRDRVREQVCALDGRRPLAAAGRQAIRQGIYKLCEIRSL